MTSASLIIDALSMLIGLAMLSLAVRGLTIWRDEKRATWRAEAARNLLRSLYEFRIAVLKHKHGAPWAVHYASQYPKESFERSGIPYPHQNIEAQSHELYSRQSQVDEALLELQVIEDYPWIASIRDSVSDIVREMNIALSSFVGEALDALNSPNNYRARYSHLFIPGEEPPGWPPPPLENLFTAIDMCDKCVSSHEPALRDIMRLESDKDLLPW